MTLMQIANISIGIAAASSNAFFMAFRGLQKWNNSMYAFFFAYAKFINNYVPGCIFMEGCMFGGIMPGLIPGGAPLLRGPLGWLGGCCCCCWGPGCGPPGGPPGWPCWLGCCHCCGDIWGPRIEAGDWGVLGGIGLVELGASLAPGITICSSCCKLLPAPPPGPVEGDEPGGL